MYVLETLERVGVKSNVGERVPLHCSAPGKVWLASLPDDRMGEVLKLVKFEPFTPYTIDNMEKLKASIAQSKELGYAIDNQENSADLISVSSPVRNYRGRVIACIAITAPALRMSEERIKEMGFNVKSTAEKVSQSMGYNK
jgi:DNA-binding IclR family transcriptional regulator